MRVLVLWVVGSGLRLNFVSKLYCARSQDLRRKASWCHEQIHGSGLRLEYHIWKGCIFRFDAFGRFVGRWSGLRLNFVCKFYCTRSQD